MTCSFIANAEVARITRVDSCGRPVCGADNGFVFECLTSLAMSPQYEDGTDVLYKAANGKRCAYKKGCPTLTGIEATINFQFISPEFIEIATGQPVVVGFDGEPIGYDDCDVKCDTGLAIELWSEILEDCDPAATNQGSWIYALLPWVTQATLGDIEIGSEAVELTLTGTTRSGGGWGVGPYLVQEQDALGTPGTLLTPLGSTCHRRIFRTEVPPPTASCDYTPVTAGVCAP